MANWNSWFCLAAVQADLLLPVPSPLTFFGETSSFESESSLGDGDDEDL
jgi:hypothetical protein